MTSVAIVSVLAALAISTLDPLRQFNKARDSRRVSDITKIRNASDIYYDDLSCYPTSVTPGGILKNPNNATTYLNPVPKDPGYAGNLTQTYIYEVDKSSCPQWNVIFGKLSDIKNKAITLCPLTQMSNCLPPDFPTSGYNYCVISGNVNCSYISVTPIFGTPIIVAPVPTLKPTSTPTPTPTPAPTPTPPPCTPNNYSCSQGRCNLVPNGTGMYCNNSCNGAC